MSKVNNYIPRILRFYWTGNYARCVACGYHVEITEIPGSNGLSPNVRVWHPPNPDCASGGEKGGYYVVPKPVSIGEEIAQ